MLNALVLNKLVPPPGQTHYASTPEHATIADQRRKRLRAVQFDRCNTGTYRMVVRGQGAPERDILTSACASMATALQLSPTVHDLHIVRPASTCCSTAANRLDAKVQTKSMHVMSETTTL